MANQTFMQNLKQVEMVMVALIDSCPRVSAEQKAARAAATAANNMLALQAQQAKFATQPEDTLVEDVVAELMHEGIGEDKARAMVANPARLQELARKYDFV